MDGLDKFREAFAEYSDNYVVIGGAACDITMANTVVRPRATHDIDARIGNTQCLSNQLGYVFSNEHQDFSHGKYLTI